MMPARPAPMIATVIVSGMGTVRGSVGCEQLEAALLEQQRNEFVVHVGAERQRQQPLEQFGIVGGECFRCARRVECVDDGRHKRLRSVRIGDACALGRVGHV